jgi:type II restriction/modification system DNA methylase subunit YeeA
MNIHDFKQRWRGVSLSERSAAHQHFLDLCQALGMPTPAAADPEGSSYTFEKGVRKTGGGSGFADVWKRGHFAWEYKGQHANLDKAYQQLLQYREDLENPPLLVVCDLDRFEVHTNWTNTVKRVYRFDLETIEQPENLRVLRALFNNPEELRPQRTVESATEEAASRIGSLALQLRDRGVAADKAAHFLVQILFCLFAEDVRLLPRGLFGKLLDVSARDPQGFTGRIEQLFTAMRDGGEAAYEPISRFNGGLFEVIEVVSLTKPELATLAEAATLDWSSIEPAIIGTLFERSLDPSKRAQLGAHYTGRADILRVTDPVVLAPLRRRWETVKAEAEAIREKHAAAGRLQERNRSREQFIAKLEEFLGELRTIRVLDPACGSGNFLAVALTQLLDLEKEVNAWAAGTGMVPMRFPEVRPDQMLGLEINPYAQQLTQVVVWISYLQWMTGNGFEPSRDPVLGGMDTIRLQDSLLDVGCPLDRPADSANYPLGVPSGAEALDYPTITPSGTEALDHPAVAPSGTVALDHPHVIPSGTPVPSNPTVVPSGTLTPDNPTVIPSAVEGSHAGTRSADPSVPPSRPIRDSSTPKTPLGMTPREGDAPHATARPKEAAWPPADFIIGNPPFLGGKRLRSELGDRTVDDLFAVYDGRVARESDLCCYFFEKARAQIDQGHSRRAGLLATNSIRGGANREALQRIKQTGDIFMAWDDEPWILDGAAVRISIVGFDNGTETERQLDGVPVNRINADLTGTVDITIAPRLVENLGIAFMGDTKGGSFDISGEFAQQLLAAPVNPNGRTNHDVVRPWVNGSDIVRRPRGVWIIDFGVDMPEEEAALYEQPFEYVKNIVRPERATNNRERYRSHWWLHVEPRPGMRDALSRLSRFIVTPRVAKHRVFIWATSPTLPDSRIFVFARDNDYFFGILHSRAHEVWSLRTASWHGVGNDPTYNTGSCFETFPFPRPSAEQEAAIGAAAKRLDELRTAWLNPDGASEADLKKRTLTNLYNQRPTWLAQAHAALDRAVWAAYGWDDSDPAAVEEDVILARLLALNLERERA